MADSYFQIRDAEHTAWFVSQDFHNVADVAAMVTNTLYAVNSEETTDSISRVLRRSGVSFKAISEDTFQASARTFRAKPADGLLVELDLKGDDFCCSNWVLPEKKVCTVSAMLSRITGIYELALTRPAPNSLDLDVFATGLWNHCSIKFTEPQILSDEQRVQNDPAPEQTASKLPSCYRTAELIATYEELLCVPAAECVTEYFGDYGGHFMKHGVTDDQALEVYHKALAVLGMDSDTFQKEERFVYRGEIISAMRDRLLADTLQQGETVLFVGTEPYGGPGDFHLRSGVVESVDKESKTCSVRGTFFTMNDVPLHYVLGRYDRSAQGEHYGFQYVVPLFGENQTMADHYLREAEKSWNARFGDGPSETPSMTMQ